MENAAKALIIAGGILLAIMILSLLVYMLGITNTMAQAQDEKKVAEQLVAFNNEYEAYNKRVLYGVEVITVARKAIQYNGSLKPEDADKAITITMKLDDDFSATEQTIIYYANGDVDDDNEPTIIGGVSLAANTEGYTFGYTSPQNVLDFFKQPTEDIIKGEREYSNRTETTYYYSALTNFKRAIFTCTSTEYDKETGRLKAMTFEQK